MSTAENSSSNDTLFRHGVCAFWATIEIKVKLGRFKFEVHHLTDYQVVHFELETANYKFCS